MPRPFSQLTPGGHGEVAVGTSAVQVKSASTPCKMVHLKAKASNTNKVYIGIASTVTAADGSTDGTSGIELSAGEEIQIWVANVSTLYAIGGAASQAVTYLYYI